MPTTPWEYHPHLTADRLIAIAQLIAEGRNSALELHDAIEGDNGWTLGCRAFQFARHRILTASIDPAFEWLGVVDESLRLIFTIGEVPVRIYRGEAEDPTDRTMRQSNAELRQMSFSFSDDDEGNDLLYRFAVDTDFDGSIMAINFVGLRGESAVLNWPIPYDGEDASTGTVGTPADDQVDLPSPSISRPHGTDNEEEAGE